MKHKRKQRGFSLIEMLMAVALLLTVTGVVFTQINSIINRYNAEDTRMTAVDDTREFVDQIVRDLHQNSFPSQRIRTPAFTQLLPFSNNGVAVGMVQANPTQIQFEAALDGVNGVQEVVYQLVLPGTTTLVTDLTQCPCSLQRGQAAKQANTAPENQAQPTFTTEVDNVINPVSEPPFRFFDWNGKELTSIPTFNSGAPVGGTISQIYSVKISVTVQGKNADPVTHLKPEVTYTATAQMNN